MRDRNFSTVIAADQMPVEAYSSILKIDDRWTGCNEVKYDEVDEESEAVSWVASAGSARAHDVVVDGEPVGGVSLGLTIYQLRSQQDHDARNLDDQ
jgi:hypothetical protein